MIPTMEMISATEMTPNHHRNDPHYRNDTGGHHRNDPRNIGNGIKRTTKTGQQFSACFLFNNYLPKAKLVLLNNCFSVFTRSDLNRIRKETIKKTISLIDG